MRIEVHRYGALFHAAHEISFARCEGREVTYPTIVIREDGKAVLRLDQVTRRSMVVVVRHRVAQRHHLAEHTRQCVPLTVTFQRDVHRVFRQGKAKQVHTVLLERIDHIHLPIIEGLERSDELICSLAISAELACSRILDQVAFRPWLLCRDRRGQGGRYIQIGRYPAPSRIECDSLHLATAGLQLYGIILAATIDSAVRKEDERIRCEVIDLTRSGFPQLEADRLVSQFFAAVNREIEFAIVGAMGCAYTIIVVYSEDIILGCGVDYRLVGLVQDHIAAQRHIERIAIQIHVDVRRFGLLGYLEQ